MFCRQPTQSCVMFVVQNEDVIVYYLFPNKRIFCVELCIMITDWWKNPTIRFSVISVSIWCALRDNADPPDECFDLRHSSGTRNRSKCECGSSRVLMLDLTSPDVSAEAAVLRKRSGHCGHINHKPMWLLLNCSNDVQIMLMCTAFHRCCFQSQLLVFTDLFKCLFWSSFL